MTGSHATPSLSSVVAVLVSAIATGCQYDNPCGDRGLEHSRGVCFPRMPDPPPPGESDASTVADADAGEAGAASPDPRCVETCDLVGRCVAANAQVSGVLMSELMQLGFKGTDPAGCVQTCDAKRAGSGDDAALDCFEAENKAAMCSTDGLTGALPAVDAVNKCCENAKKSEFCVHLCGLLLPNMTAGSFFTSCPALVP